MEKKVYSSYAFKENEREMMKINRQIYEELEERYKILKVSDIDHKAPTRDELALICDGGNLCFGYRGDKKFLSVSED